MKILFVIHQFPPLNKIGTFRTFSFVKEWLKGGHEITVLTSKKYQFDGDLNFHPDELNNPKLRVIEIEYASWLTNRYLDKANINQSSKGETKLGKIKSLVRVLRRHIIGANFDIHSLWISNACEAGAILLEKENFDFLFSSYSPPASHIVASRLKQKFPKLFWVADYRDLWSGNHLTGGNFIVNSYIKNKEKKTIQDANILITVSSPLKKHLEVEFMKKTFVVENGYDIQEIESLDKKKLYPEDDVIRLVYTGSIFYKRRDPTPLFLAVKKLEREGLINDNKLRILFYGDKNFIIDLAKKSEIESYIDIKGYVPKSESLKAQRDADALIFLEYEDPQSTNLSAKGVLTGKLFEYLASKTEIIGVGISNTTLSGNLIESSNTGKCFLHDSNGIHETLKSIVTSGKKEIKPNWELIKSYERSKKANTLITIIKKELGI